MTSKKPVVTKGSHLTVTQYADGKTELNWDWDALVKDVNEAINSVNLVKVTEEKVKKTRSKKK